MRLHPALVALALLVPAGAATAAPPPASGSCNPISQGFQSWISFELRHIDCTAAHELARSWSGSCARSSRSSETLHCTVPQRHGPLALPFNCANRKGAHGTTHYAVDCGNSRQLVKFTYFPHGF